MSAGMVHNVRNVSVVREPTGRLRGVDDRL